MKRSRPNPAGARERGATLVVGLVLLALVTLLGLAGADAAHLEHLLAQNERFRENAASAASTGLEVALGRIVTTADPATLSAEDSGLLPGSTDRFVAVSRFAGYETSLPQADGPPLAGAHFEIVSTGYSARGAVDRQRATAMLVVESADATPQLCAPVVAARCLAAGQLLVTSWQRLPLE